MMNILVTGFPRFDDEEDNAAQNEVDIKAGFVHVPFLPTQVEKERPESTPMELDVTRRAMVIIIRHAAERLTKKTVFEI